MDFVFNVMDFVFNVMDFVFNVMDFAFNVMDFAFNVMKIGCSSSGGGSFVPQLRSMTRLSCVH